MMKTTVICAVFVLAVVGFTPRVALGQASPEGAKPAKQALTPAQVPAAVARAFAAKFPGVAKVDWSIKSDKNYEAEFTAKGAEVAVKFDVTGKWLETESAIPPASVPKPVMDTVAASFKTYKVIETQNMLRWDEKALIYELHLENAKEVVKAMFSSDGKIISQSAKPKTP
jgi:hypothetical protein